MSHFVIGIGSQRTGSTLLHKILSECSPVFMHPVKELHYYDTLFSVRHASVLVKFSKMQLEYFGEKKPKKKRDICFVRTNRILATQAVETVDYIDLYRPCIMGNRYLGEITPEYMILPEEGVRKMWEDLGSSTRIILISRNPVDRFISSVKLLKSYGGGVLDRERFEQELLEVMETMPGWIEHQDELNDYETALEKYRKYFDHILFLSYERMIGDAEYLYKELSSFLDEDLDRQKIESIMSRRVNDIGETGSISEKTRAMLEERFRPYTQYLESVFGEIYD